MSLTIAWSIIYLSLCPCHTANHHCRMKYFTLSPVRYRGTIRTTANGILIIFQLTNASGSGCCCISRTTAGDVIKTWDDNVSTAIRVFRDGRIKSWRFFFHHASRIYLHSFRAKVNFTRHEFWQLRLYVVKRANIQLFDLLELKRSAIWLLIMVRSVSYLNG